ncbi:LacI family transcriptional regulator [Nakamurella sp. UYEF19]|uniref:LacI family DNA-binding transcriptional regulator n=1 Tax=Nakamurella sp. UYEF19 TaxID=1756392 RepID=UPI00339AB869
MVRSTLADVARGAGVSVASVSRVLNGLPASIATRDRVREVAHSLGYAPDLAARSLKIRRTEQISVVIDDLANPAYVSMMQGAEAVLRDAGYRIQFSSIGSDSDLGLGTALHAVSRGYADGLIICPLRMNSELVETLRHAPIPVVVIGGLPRGTAIDNVVTDSRLGVNLAMDHLHQLGRRRIAFIDGPLGTNPGDRRLEGYRSAVERLGLPDEDGLRRLTTEFSYAKGAAAAADLIVNSQFDALLAANDMMAIGAMHAIARAGLRVPHRVAVVGIDDSEMCLYSSPPLTSVSLGSRHRGKIAARLLLRRLARPDAPIKRVREAPRLVARDSTSARDFTGADDSTSARDSTGARAKRRGQT